MDVEIPSYDELHKKYMKLIKNKAIKKIAIDWHHEIYRHDSKSRQISDADLMRTASGNVKAFGDKMRAIFGE